MKFIYAFPIFIFSLFHTYQAKAAITLSDTTVNFGVVFSKDTASKAVAITNPSNKSITIHWSLMDGQRFSIKDSLITIPANGTDSLRIKFHPIHNISYASEIILYSSDDDYHQWHIHLAGQGRYHEAYYSTTENKSEQELKNILKGILAKNYVSLGYNGARDKMYMEIDNKKNNGQGASKNTLECAYTGRTIVGYTSRSDAQGSPYDFNTEHTWPQSLFSSAEPMLSDLNHIFPTDNAANNKRGNDPFGVVNNPTWQVGGSKAVTGTFEPRDPQKGRSARAILYFALRYQNYSKYLNGMETTLKKWNMEFLPTKADSIRNEDIYSLQKNRNPLIDHPEFAERITSFSDSSYAPADSSNFLSQNSMSFSLTENDSIYTFKFYMVNTGNTTLNLGNFVNNNPSLTLNNTGSSLNPGEAAAIAGTIRYNPLNRIYQDTIRFQYGAMQKYISYQVTSNVGVNQTLAPTVQSMYPNPADDKLYITGTFENVSIYNLQGNQILITKSNNQMLDVSELASGIYIVRMIQGDQTITQKIIVQH